MYHCNGRLTINSQCLLKIISYFLFKNSIFFIFAFISILLFPDDTFSRCVSYVDLWHRTLWGHWYKRSYIFGWTTATLYQPERLQSVQNTARLIWCQDHNAGTISFQCWLLMRRRIVFETAIILLVWKCTHGVGPAYLQERCVPVENVPRL